MSRRSSILVAFVTLVLLLSGCNLGGGLTEAEAQTRWIRQDKIEETQGVTIYQCSYWSQHFKVRGELYIPSVQEGEQLRAVVFNHDGISGISKSHRKSSVRLAKMGYVVFSPSYRGEDGSEGQIEIAKGEVLDVLNVIPYLWSTPEVKREPVVMFGASHGALISVLAASRSQKIAGVIAAYGVMDIYRWWDYLKANKMAGGDKITRQTYGDGPQDRPLSFKIRNALGVVDKLEVPVLLLQGKKDKIVPYEQAQLMYDEMTAKGKEVELFLYEDALHGFIVYAPYDEEADPKEKEQTEKAWQEVERFLKAQLP